ncbi:MAG: acylphosphatase [Chthoniobacteraceae bacterium]
MTGRHVFYEGRVQGVGFRYTTKRIASGFEVTGWVRNLDDGRVELRITGDEEEADAFLEAIRDSELGSHIKNETVSNVPPQREVKGFEIHG